MSYNHDVGVAVTVGIPVENVTEISALAEHYWMRSKALLQSQIHFLENTLFRLEEFIQEATDKLEDVVDPQVRIATQHAITFAVEMVPQLEAALDSLKLEHDARI